MKILKITTLSFLVFFCIGNIQANPGDTTSINADEIEMIKIEGGVFEMGSIDSAGSEDEWPRHKVKISDYYISKYEITQKQYQDIMGVNPSNFVDCPTCPVENVSKLEAETFAVKLSMKHKKNYRLPTEAEWEYAARGGNKSKNFTYSGSNNLDTVGWYLTNSKKKTHPVGQKLPNELGLYDMTGNVWEWCFDLYFDKYYKQSPKEDPMGPTDGTDYVVKGGAYDSRVSFMRLSQRREFNEEYRNKSLGFRVVIATKMENDINRGDED